jgi:murein DD-endopeptidase MepM/ murein hydrolase activator NlpD
MAALWTRGSSLTFLLTVLCLAVPVVAENTAAVPEKPWSIQHQPTNLVNGVPVLFQVAAPATLKTLAGRWLGHDIYFAWDPAAHTWYGLAGIGLETAPGQYSLALSATSSGGAPLAFEHKFDISKARYRSIAVKVAKKFTAPDAEQLKQIDQARVLKEEAFKHFDPDRLWAGDFHPPVNAAVSDVFGTGRTFNGKVQSRHQGLDYAVPSGTPVAAANRGTVLLARSLYFEGNCVVLDHGQGWMTLYMHLSEIKVKEGESIARGQELGLSGGSGRATGPHLHIAVRWQGIYLDPAVLMKIQLPKTTRD